jgi:hypothetical protein
MAFTCIQPQGYPASQERADVLKEFIEFIGYQGFWYKSVICPGTTYRVTNEIQQFKTPYDTIITLDGYLSLAGGTTNWDLPDTNVISGTVSVKNVSGTITYLLNSDYTVDYANGQVIRVETGAISSSGEVSVNYSWTEPCVDIKTGNPRVYCPVCDGVGWTYEDPEPVYGLYHVPRFDSPLTEVGYWRFGDVYFTVSAFSDIGIRTKNEMHLLLRDKLVINNREYRVMEEGSTFNMQNEILGCRLHLRLLEKG